MRLAACQKISWTFRHQKLHYVNMHSPHTPSSCVLFPNLIQAPGEPLNAVIRRRSCYESTYSLFLLLTFYTILTGLWHFTFQTWTFSQHPENIPKEGGHFGTPEILAKNSEVFQYSGFSSIPNSIRDYEPFVKIGLGEKERKFGSYYCLSWISKLHNYGDCVLDKMVPKEKFKKPFCRLLNHLSTH